MVYCVWYALDLNQLIQTDATLKDRTKWDRESLSICQIICAKRRKCPLHPHYKIKALEKLSTKERQDEGRLPLQ